MWRKCRLVTPALGQEIQYEFYEGKLTRNGEEIALFDLSYPFTLYLVQVLVFFWFVISTYLDVMAMTSADQTPQAIMKTAVMFLGLWVLRVSMFNLVKLARMHRVITEYHNK